MFNFLKKSLQKIYSHITSKLDALFGRSVIDEQTLNELEILLIAADTGVKTTRIIIEQLKAQIKQGSIARGSDLKIALSGILQTILKNAQTTPVKSRIHLLVGINGSGKTTFAGKLA